MFKRAWFLAITLFWVTMNVLLWRSEMSVGQDAGSPLPVEAVWERILTAPDESSLEVYRRGQKIGYVRWVPRVEEPNGAPVTDEANPNAPEGRVKRITGYELYVDGSVSLDDTPQRLRFTCQVALDAQQVWKKVRLRFNLRPTSLEVRADAAAQTVTFVLGEDPPMWEQTFAFADLGQPQALLGALGLPLPVGPLASLLPGPPKSDRPPLSLNLEWQARSDTLKIGTARTRIYRLGTRFLDKYEATALISRVGEILRLELPDQVLLVNEALPLLPENRE